MAPVAPQTQRSLISLLVAALATAAFGVAFHCRLFPLGVPGELEAPRLGTWDVPIAPWVAMLPAAAAGGAIVAFVVWSLGRVQTARREAFIFSIVGCIALGGVFQLFLEIAAPNGLQKWVVLHHGFRAAARLKFDDVPSVLKNHAAVARELEPNHVSANPAGWIVIYRALLSFFDAHPRVAQAVWYAEPQEIKGPLWHNFGTPKPDQAAIAVVALVSRLAALAVGLPIAWLVRQRFGRPAALAACAMAGLVPAAPLLAPAVDTVYPTFAALIVALSWYASQRRSAWAAGAAGGLIGIGMFFSLSFVVVAGLCVLMVAFRALAGHRPTGASMLAAVSAWLAVIGLFAGVFGHRLWESWSVNLAKNHEFNACCGCTYGVWVGVNLLELAVVMGIPATVFLLARILPLPSGEGRGEGTSGGQRAQLSAERTHARERTDAEPDATRPHPNPLPKGEGTVTVLPLPSGEGRGEGALGGPRAQLSADASPRRERTDAEPDATRPHPSPLPKGEGTGALAVAWLAIVLGLDLSGTNMGEVSRLWLFLMPLGAALAVEWVDTASRRGRAIVGSLLVLQAFNCILLSREVVLLWPAAPRQIQEQYLASPGGKWASYRRLSDAEINRRKSDTDK